MEHIKLLGKIGLSELEASTYLALLKGGEMSSGELSKQLKLQRSTAYYLISALQEKGLILESLKNKRKLFAASSPVVLEQQAKEIYEEIKEAIPKMIVKENNIQTEGVLFVKGYKGVKSVYEEMLQNSKKGDEFLVLGARGGEDVSTITYRNFYQNFNNRRVKRGISQKIIMNHDLKDTIGNYYEKLPLTKVKYLKQKTFAPLVIFPKSIAIVHWKKDPILYLLKEESIRDSFKQYFDYMWDLAT